MTSFGERKREAFRFFEEGKYDESYDLCSLLLKETQEPQVEVLAATSLYNLGRLDEAELHFRDLAGKMPGSSHVHGFLGKVLRDKGEEGAIAEFSIAVRIDPDNQDALRNYVQCLLNAGDYRRSLSAQRRLAERSRREDDARDLIATLVKIGEGREALELCEKFPSLKSSTDPLYVDALAAAGEFSRAGETARAEYERSGNPVFLRKFLAVLSKYDPGAALGRYRDAFRDSPDKGMIHDYIDLLVSNQLYQEAIPALGSLESLDTDMSVRLTRCRVLSFMGERERAKHTCEALIMDATGNTGSDTILRDALRFYQEFLLTFYPKQESVQVFTRITSANVNPVCLSETGRLYERLGDITEARGWYYRAYRGDYIAGGLEYAKFLARHNDWRECEKVMLYILSNVKKTPDIVRVAGVTTGDGMIHHTPRLLFQLIERLEGRQENLSAEGLEFLAVAYLVAGTNAISDGDYPVCKRYCLRGLDVLPAYSSCIGTGDFIAVLGRCKERSIVDLPVISNKQDIFAAAKSELPRVKINGLEPVEEKVLEFMKLHRRASEADLRKLLGTRRVNGIMNRLIAKTVAQGVRLVTKKGCGEQGEIYEYTGA